MSPGSLIRSHEHRVH
ncbi:unnamed protein product [Rhizoctonia solani]|uniref:Uncharacterized protein n=1 Tax=Rhizoctonia solani TaxID=456999 RepID=A0A8H3BLT9_9AGAM|nr:unnamed protein product [Rhizoctonia solani]